MGPALSTEELREWCASRGLSNADTEQLIAVGVDRDRAWRKYHRLHEHWLKERKLLLSSVQNTTKKIRAVLRSLGDVQA